MNNKWKKKSKEELMEYLLFRSRGSKIEAKKGKGALYNRANKKQADYKARKQEIE